MTTTPHSYALAAVRARSFAAITRRWSSRSISRDALLMIAQALELAAWQFEDGTPSTASGGADGNAVPAEPLSCLYTADDIAEEGADVHFAAIFRDYVTAAVHRTEPEMPRPLLPLNPELIAQEDRIRTGLELLHSQLAAATDQGTTTALLEAVLALRAKHARLGSVVPLDNARPCFADLYYVAVPDSCWGPYLARRHSTWKVWEIPAFSRAVARQITDFHATLPGLTERFDWDGDDLYFSAWPDSSGEQWDREPVERTHDGHYLIGAGEWCWDEVSPEDC
ncbi:hypothetical protein [Streptomyces boncukensis]|uniref:Uncharacterized protein n=1 Tax=Streptomyces boncukensis TaxID=2711219 RepID=A0A6G4WP75_9ACTN|nr:hypothetical protein [Streptomyces boncukensis]NGO67005.1 hypothetical protein [Streptomyces boncukensis]